MTTILSIDEQLKLKSELDNIVSRLENEAETDVATRKKMMARATEIVQIFNEMMREELKSVKAERDRLEKEHREAVKEKTQLKGQIKASKKILEDLRKIIAQQYPNGEKKI